MNDVSSIGRVSVCKYIRPKATKVLLNIYLNSILCNFQFFYCEVFRFEWQIKTTEKHIFHSIQLACMKEGAR